MSIIGGISQFFINTYESTRVEKNFPVGVRCMANVDKLLDADIEEIKNINKGEVFSVRDLFKGYIWNRIPKNDRIGLGTLFIEYIKEMDGDEVITIPKITSKRQKIRNLVSENYLLTPIYNRV